MHQNYVLGPKKMPESIDKNVYIDRKNIKDQFEKVDFWSAALTLLGFIGTFKEI